ncbi:hypothetical protein B0T20DRAFT_182507 [Sordaria brevicollis]|uniref:Uncharacterized protein n=1 Tax=Sordaria brevicollis TaxID=83679 RepID=A0AAE0UED0_SORBR|nr:hypothetical protein B0T20DRAFT_182507 [Sordaria brevicollis]
MDSLLDHQGPFFDDTDPFLQVYRHAITLHTSPLLLSRYKTKASQRVSSTSTFHDLLKQTPRQNHSHDEHNTIEFRALLPRNGSTCNIPARLSSRTGTTSQTQRTVTVTLYASNHRQYKVPIKFYHQQTTKRSRLEQIFGGQMQGGSQLLSWLDITRPNLFAQIPGFVFPSPSGDPFLNPKEAVNFIGGLTDQRDGDVQRLGQLAAKFLREYFSNMSMNNRPMLYSQAAAAAAQATDNDSITDFHKDILHDIFFSIQVHRRKQNKNIVGDSLKGPHPLVARAAKEKYIQGASFHIHPAVMKKVVYHVVEARKTFLLLPKDQQKHQLLHHLRPSSTENNNKRYGSVRLLREVKSCGSILKSSSNPDINQSIILPIVPIPSTEDWGLLDPMAWLEGWDLEMESLAYMHRNKSEFGRLTKDQERELVYYQFARSVDEWIWRLGQAEKKGDCHLSGMKKADCNLGLRMCEVAKETEEEEEFLIEL